MIRPLLFQVIPTDDYKVYLYFDSGEVKLYDCSWILEKDGIFEKIHNIEDFKRMCTIMNKTLAFDISGERDPYRCIDIDPDTIYESSVKCKDILSA